MSCLRRVLAALPAILLWTSISQADIKDAVFRDCKSAQTEIEKLAPEKQSSLLPFLREVLKLHLPSGPDTLSPLPVKTLPGLSAGDAEMQHIWRGFSPDREIAAKRCVLEILKGYGASAGSALGEMLEFATDPTLSDDLRDLADGAVLQVVRDFSPVASRTSIVETARFALAERGEIAQAALAYFAPSSAIDAVLSAVKDDVTADQAVSVLGWLDPRGRTLQAVSLTILKPESPPFAQRAIYGSLGNMLCPSEEAAAVLNHGLDSAVAEVQASAAAALQLLIARVHEGSVCAQQDTGVTGSQLLSLLLEQSESATTSLSRLRLALPLLAGRNAPRAVEEYLKLLRQVENFDEELVRAALQALGIQVLDGALQYLKDSTAPHRGVLASAVASIPDLEARHLHPFVTFLLDSDEQVRAAVLQAIRRMPRDFRTELKMLPAEKGKPVGPERQLALIAAGLSDAAGLKQFIPTLGCDALAAVADDPHTFKLQSIEQALAARADECSQADAASLCQRRAWLFRIKEPGPNAARRIQVASLSSEPSCVIRALRASPPTQTISSQRLTEALLSKTEASASELVAVLEAKPKLSAEELTALRQLSESADASRKVRCQAGRLYLSGEDSDDRRRSALEKILDDESLISGCIRELPGPVVFPMLLAHLEDGNSESKVRAIALLGQVRGITAEAVDKLRALTNARAPEVRYQALVALVRRMPDSPQLGQMLLPLANSRFASRLARESYPAELLRGIRQEPEPLSPLAENVRALLVLRGEAAPAAMPLQSP